jgi:DNA-binding transcriptional LysR family regulator
MTLKQLEAFYWAASAASFLVAAERLHVSQSTLSKRISELEAQLGKALFDRSGHRAALSEAGQQLLPLARRMLGLADEMRSLVTEGDGTRGHCRFGVGELAALTWLPDLVAFARSAHPDLVLEPCVDLGAALEQRLESGELDFAVVAGYSSRSAIASEAVAQVRFSWAAAPGLVGEQRSINAKLLQETALITMPPAAGPTRMLEQWLAVNNLEAGRRLSCNNLAAIASLIGGGVTTAGPCCSACARPWPRR